MVIDPRAYAQARDAIAQIIVVEDAAGRNPVDALTKLIFKAWRLSRTEIEPSRN